MNKKAQERIVEAPQKKSKMWLWILIILILIAAGVGIYFWLSGDETGIAGLGGSAIPQPPALPN